MIASATTFSKFGISMERRSSRRRLVVLTYIVLGLVCAVVASVARGNALALSLAIWAVLLVGIFLFGGHGRYGLVKSFLNKAPRQRDAIDRLVYPDPVLIKLAASAPLLPTCGQDWKNDERELSQRDRAHYLAYQPLAVGFVLLLFLVSEALHQPAWLPLQAILNLIYLIALFASVLAITLPAAIILWTEPDLNEGSPR